MYPTGLPTMAAVTMTAQQRMMKATDIPQADACSAVQSIATTHPSPEAHQPGADAGQQRVRRRAAQGVRLAVQAERLLM